MVPDHTEERSRSPICSVVATIGVGVKMEVGEGVNVSVGDGVNIWMGAGVEVG